MIDDNFVGVRLCRVCGCNMDMKDLKVLFELHGECWKTYRKNGWVYPMPAYVGSSEESP